MPEENAEQQKPVGPFEDHEACVRHFEDDPEVDDPDALCGWMEENAGKTAVQEYQPDEGEVQELVEAMKDPAASSVLTNLEVTYVSGVENPAQDSQWVMAKDAESQGADWGVNAPIVLHEGTQTTTVDGGARAPVWSRKDGEDGEGEQEQKKAWAPVLIPNETDKQGDVIPGEAIEKAAHQFLSQFRNIDTDHDLLEGKGVPIESWTLKEESTFTLPDGSESREYPKGTWMLGVKFSDESWERIKSGELSGFSIYGEATEHDVQDLLGGGVDLEMGGAVQAFQATAKEADGGTTEMSETENENGGEGTEKQMPADAVPILVDTLNAYLASEDEDLGADLESWLQWGLDTGEIEADSIVVGGEELTAEGGGSESEDEGGDSGGDEGEGGPEQPPEEQEMSENGEGEGEQPESSTKELLEDVRDTVKSTQESVEQHGDRIQALEAEVFEKQEQEGEGESTEGEASPDEVKEQATEAATEAAEEQVKSLLGLEELPEDPEERQEVVRKHLHEQPDEGDSLGNPDEWTDDEVNGVVQ